MSTLSNTHQEVSPPAKLLYYRDLKGLGIPFSRSHLYVLMRDNKFPQAMKLTENKIAWLREEIDTWIQDKIDAHRSQGATC